jgi:elongator complex protein 3
MGLGSRLIAEAKEIARAAGYQRLAVISAIGTRAYYARRGFALDGLYMFAQL